MKRDPRERYSTTAKYEDSKWHGRAFTGYKPREIRPKTGYVLHMITSGVRLTRIAQDYFGDPRTWWNLAQANGEVLNPADLIYENHTDGEIHARLKIGESIEIPPKPEGAL